MKIPTYQIMIQSIDVAISLLDADAVHEPHSIDMKRIFDGFDPAQYEDEVHRRWGATESYKESSRRTRGYAQQDWHRIQQESHDILKEAVALLPANTQPGDSRALAIAERYRLWVDRWFYPCPRSMHNSLAGLYQDDARFAAYFNQYADGLATFISSAIQANARRSPTEG